VARIAVVGSYGVGQTFVVERAPERGETIIGNQVRTDPGGKGSNQAIGAARLGADLSFLTAIGHDAFGDSGIELWAAEGVDAGAVLRTQLPTMTAAILVEASGDNRIVIVRGALASFADPALERCRGRHADHQIGGRAPQVRGFKALAPLPSKPALHESIHGYTRTNELRDALATGAPIVTLRDGRVRAYMAAPTKA